MKTMSYSETLVVTSCWCGINVAIPSTLHRWAQQKSSNAVYCPLGHEFVYNDSFEKKLEAERRRHEATRDLLRAEENSHRATRGHLTRTRRRVQAGTCPCCKRTFKQLSRHMKTQHPDFKPEETPTT